MDTRHRVKSFGFTLVELLVVIAIIDGPWWTAMGYYVPGPVADFSGLFTIGRQNSMSSITDGTSHTVVVAEVTSAGYKWGPFMTAGTGVPRVAPAEAVFRSAFVATGVNGLCCELGLYSEVDNSGVKPPPPDNWFRAAPYSFTSTYFTHYGPNAEWPGASSFHPNAVTVVRADGSVDTINVNIHMPIWLMLNGIADNHNANKPDL